MEVLQAVADCPQKWLNYLDIMHQRAQATLALFGELLDRFEGGREEEAIQRDRDGLLEFALAFLSRLNVVKYEKARRWLLLFCVRENLAPEAIAEAASGAWEQALMGDWPLRYVCRACRLFWA